MSRNLGLFGWWRRDTGRGIHTERRSRDTAPGVGGGQHKLPARRRRNGVLMAALVMLLAIPSGGCLGDLMCSETCEGVVDCSEYSVAACASQAGCTVSGNACTGSQSCGDVTDDEDSCKSHEYCHWERNCC